MSNAQGCYLVLRHSLTPTTKFLSLTDELPNGFGSSSVFASGASSPTDFSKRR